MNLKKLFSVLVILAFASPVFAEGTSFAMEYMGCVDPIKKPGQECNYETSQKFCADFAKLPEDVKSSISQQMECNFLGGEITGDPKLDVDTNKSIEKAGCDRNDTNALRAVHENWANKEAAEAALFFAEKYEDASNRCNNSLQ